MTINNKYKDIKRKVLFVLFLTLVFGIVGNKVLAQENDPQLIYIPLIGVTSVPDPIALPDGEGDVTYHYAVKNFLEELALQDIEVVDDNCNPIVYSEGDDNGNQLLDHDETWRYTCETSLNQTTSSKATATGHFNNVVATHNAYSTVVVGDTDPAPIVSVVNVSKIAYPLSLPVEGGDVTFTYRVNNPGVLPLSFVRVNDEKCSNLSNKLGDINGNNLLDPNEVWIYTCTTRLTETTTNTVKVSAYSNGIEAIDEHTITVRVDRSTPSNELAQSEITPRFPNTGEDPGIKNDIWKALLLIILALSTILILTSLDKRLSRKNRFKRPRR
jgi:hypothetical protein